MVQKTYRVDFDMKYSHVFEVKAHTPGEAKHKAFEKLQKICKKRSQFNIDIDTL